MDTTHRPQLDTDASQLGQGRLIIRRIHRISLFTSAQPTPQDPRLKKERQRYRANGRSPLDQVRGLLVWLQALLDVSQIAVTVAAGKSFDRIRVPYYPRV